MTKHKHEPLCCCLDHSVPITTCPACPHHAEHQTRSQRIKAWYHRRGIVTQYVLFGAALQLAVYVLLAINVVLT